MEVTVDSENSVPGPPAEEDQQSSKGLTGELICKLLTALIVTFLIIGLIGVLVLHAQMVKDSEVPRRTHGPGVQITTLSSAEGD